MKQEWNNGMVYDNIIYTRFRALRTHSLPSLTMWIALGKSGLISERRLSYINNTLDERIILEEKHKRPLSIYR